ncbi:MAG: hypothetical protein OXG44_06125 [Gammaproteobacteria bacterium]|nr:hypothetical protein [Gammaproteobacteria bacterium]
MSTRHPVESCADTFVETYSDLISSDFIDEQRCHGMRRMQSAFQRLNDAVTNDGQPPYDTPEDAWEQRHFLAF